MGQLRTGILDLQKVTLDLPPKIKAVEELQNESKNRVWGAAARITAGFDMSNQYLIEKFKKANTTIAAQVAKPLKDVMDPGLATLIKGIGTAKDDVKNMITGLNSNLKVRVDAVLATITGAEAKAAALKAAAAKKKDKLFKSAKYKEKIKGYLAALDAIDGILKKQKASLQKVQAIKQGHDWVDKNFKLAADFKVSDIKEAASMEFNSQMKTYLQDKEKIDSYVRQFRDDYKPMTTQLALMKNWSDEADAMEKEADTIK